MSAKHDASVFSKMACLKHVGNAAASQTYVRLSLSLDGGRNGDCGHRSLSSDASNVSTIPSMRL